MPDLLKPYAKGIVALIGAVITIASVKWSAEPWFQYVIAALTALGVYGVPNASPTPE